MLELTELTQTATIITDSFINYHGLVYLPIRQRGTIDYKICRALVVESTFKEVVGREFFVFIAGEVSL